jgi:large subunit ribosomal protein L11
MAKPKKEIKGKIKLIIRGGQANPAPPLGPILGQNGIPLQDFCTQFNEKTKDRMGEELPVAVTIYKDNSFDMRIFQPTVSGMLKKASGVQKGSGTANKDKVGKVTDQQIAEIAERKMPDLNTRNLESAKRVVVGTAKSMGLEVV